MSGIVEVPVETVDDSETHSEPTESVEAIPESVEVLDKPEKAVAKSKAKMGRPTGKKDTKPRAKPKPKAKAVVEQRLYTISESSSSEDEASLQELHALHLMRAVRSYDQTRLQRKNDRYASWFGR